MDEIEEFRYLVLAAQREGNRALTSALKDHDLTMSQAEAIAVLRDAGRPLTVREVGDRLVCEGGSPSRLMATLTRKDLVQSSAGAKDRRTIHLTLTRKGAEAARIIGQIEQDLYAGLRLSITDDQLASTLPALRGLVAPLPAGIALQRRIEDKNSADRRTT